jgi:hypothetical protein
LTDRRSLQSRNFCSRLGVCRVGDVVFGGLRARRECRAHRVAMVQWARRCAGPRWQTGQRGHTRARRGTGPRWHGWAGRTRGQHGPAGPPGPSWPDVFVVHPNAVAPLYWTIQSAIDAAVSGGERTDNNPAIVLVLPGQYVENIQLHKHVAVWGFDRLGDYSTVLRGQVTCNLVLEGGVREKTFTSWAGVSIFPPIGAAAGILFTGNNSQKLIIHDTAIEGTAPALVVENLYVSGTGTSQVLVTDCRLRGLAASSPALRVDAGSVECNRCDIWNRQPVAAASSPGVVVVGPSVGRAQVAQLALSDCNLEGVVTLDGRLSTATTAGAVFLSLLRCTHKIQFVAASPINFIATYSAPPAGIVTASLLLSVFSAYGLGRESPDRVWQSGHVCTSGKQAKHLHRSAWGSRLS